MKKLLPYVLAFHAALAAAILLWALQEKFHLTVLWRNC